MVADGEGRGAAAIWEGRFAVQWVTVRESGGLGMDCGEGTSRLRQNVLLETGRKDGVARNVSSTVRTRPGALRRIVSLVGRGGRKGPDALALRLPLPLPFTRLDRLEGPRSGVLLGLSA